LASASFADTPDRVLASWSIGDGIVKRLAALPDGSVVAAVTADGRVGVLDTETWLASDKAPCVARAVELELEPNGDGVLVYVGCQDGTVRTLQHVDGVLRTWDGEGTFASASLATAPIVALHQGSDGVLYGLAYGSGDKLSLVDVNPSTGDVQVSGDVFSLTPDGYVEAVFVASSVAGTDDLYVVHGDDGYSALDLGTRTAPQLLGLTLNADPVDVDGVPGAIVGSGILVYMADPDGGLFGWTGLTTSGVTGSPIRAVGTGLAGITSVAVTTASSGALTSLLVQKDGTFYALDPASASPSPATALASFDATFRAYDVLQARPGAVFAGTDDGRIALLGDGLYAGPVSLTPAIAPSASEVAFTFTPKDAGTWILRRGGTRDGGGTELLRGEAVAGVAVNGTFVVDDGFVEGDNTLWLALENGARKGASRVDFRKDDAPPTVSLSDANVRFADSALVVEFAGSSEPDVEAYNVYISSTPFSADDYPLGGGPIAAGSSGSDTGLAGSLVVEVASPVRVEQPEDGGRVSVRLTGLANYVTYFIGVRAVDTGGTEGPMSQVVSEMPRPSSTAGDVTGETGGPMGCQLLPTGGVGLGVVALVLAGWRRRRVAAILVGAGLAFASTGARADEDRERPEGPAFLHARDTTPQVGFVRIGHDLQPVATEALRAAYAPALSVLRLEAGVVIEKIVQIDAGLGFASKKGYQIDPSTLEASSDRSRMQWLPIHLGATLRAHVLDEQPVVPYGRGGFDMVWFREDALADDLTPDKTSRLTGSKVGGSVGGGVMILLDTLAPSRAGRLEATSGLNDTWIDIGYRHQWVGKDQPFDFSGGSLSVALQLDF
jgi:hypothetical protein